MSPSKALIVLLLSSCCLVVLVSGRRRHSWRNSDDEEDEQELSKRCPPCRGDCTPYTTTQRPTPDWSTEEDLDDDAEEFFDKGRRFFENNKVVSVKPVRFIMKKYPRSIVYRFKITAFLKRGTRCDFVDIIYNFNTDDYMGYTFMEDINCDSEINQDEPR